MIPSWCAWPTPLANASTSAAALCAGQGVPLSLASRLPPSMILHLEEDPAVAVADVIDLGDVRVPQPGDRLGLRLEAECRLLDWRGPRPESSSGAETVQAGPAGPDRRHPCRRGPARPESRSRVWWASASATGTIGRRRPGRQGGVASAVADIIPPRRLLASGGRLAWTVIIRERRSSKSPIGPRTDRVTRKSLFKFARASGLAAIGLGATGWRLAGAGIVHLGQGWGIRDSPGGDIHTILWIGGMILVHRLTLHGSIDSSQRSQLAVRAPALRAKK